MKERKEKPLVEKLVSLGLSRAGALVYIYLLERGLEVGVSKIAAGTGMHRQQVYITLPELLEAGLIEAVATGRVAKYRARPPHSLERVARRRMADAEVAAAELQKVSRLGHEQDFEAVVGTEACRSFELERARRMEPGSEQYIIGTEKDEYLDIMGSVYASAYVPILEEKKIVTYYLAPETQATRKELIDERQIFRLRTLKDLTTGPLATMVQGDQLVFYVNVRPATIYVIKSQKVAEGYKQFFMMLWNMAK